MDDGLIPGMDPSERMTKNQRRNQARRERKKANQAVLRCLAEEHHVGRMSVDAILKRYGVVAEPGSVVFLDRGQGAAFGEESDAFRCTVCEKIREQAEEVEQRRLEAVRRDQENRLEVFRRSCEEGRRGVDYHFRPDQRTHVTVHNVKLLWRRKKNDVVLVATSFQGHVIDVSHSIDEEMMTFESIIRVQLRPREDLDFRQVRPCPANALEQTGGGLALKRAENKMCIVDVPYNSDLLVLGARCKGRCPEEGCENHTLKALLIFKPSKK